MKPLIFIAILFGVISPGYVSAQPLDDFEAPPLSEQGVIAEGQGFVPCSGVSCSACDFVTVINTIIKWLIGIISLIFAVLMVVTGFKLVTSGGNASAKEAAKSSFTNAIIGFLIVLAAWLVVDTLMRTLLGESGEIKGYGPWSEIECGSQNVTTLAPPGTYKINENFTITVNEKGEQTVSENTALGGACDLNFVRRYFPDNAGEAQCIITEESSCGANLDSRSDRMTATGLPFSFGPMQINITYHKLVGCGPNGTTLNCPAAFNGRNYSATIRNRALYDQCAAAARTFSCNLANGKIIRDNRGSWRDWSTAGACGLR